MPHNGYKQYRPNSVDNKNNSITKSNFTSRVPTSGSDNTIRVIKHKTTNRRTSCSDVAKKCGGNVYNSKVVSPSVKFVDAKGMSIGSNIYINGNRSVVDQPALSVDGLLNVKLTDLLRILIESLIRRGDTRNVAYISYPEVKFGMNLYGNVNYEEIFSSTAFLSNYTYAFGQSFGYSQDEASEIADNIKIKIINDLPTPRVPNISDFELYVFKLVCCTFFGMKCNVKLNGCSCYPKNSQEYMAITAGIGLNCINMDCKSELIHNPDSFDSLIHTDCSDINFNAIFLSMQTLVQNKVNIEKINILQKITQ